MSRELTQVSKFKSFGGWQYVYTHDSEQLKCKMNFGVYLPPQATSERVPVIYWLSGLTCTEQNFVTKAGAQHYASENGVALVAPDTSPRGCNIPGEDESWDFGTGAGFYVDATSDKWKHHYRMYSYVTDELPELIAANFHVSDRAEPTINKKHVPSSNGCGSFGIKVTATDMPGMTACCDVHDICYDTCGSQKSACDDAFHECLSEICVKMKHRRKPAAQITGCETAVALMYGGTTTFGCTAFTDAQRNACVCSGDGRSNQRKTERPQKARLRMPKLDDDWLRDEF